MSEQKIKVTISPLGLPTVEAVGFNGVGCEDATKALEQALASGGGMERVFKPEWSASEEEGQHEQQRMW